jgi:hypothetical protein
MIAIAVPTVETVLEFTHHLRVQCTRHCRGDSASSVILTIELNTNAGLRKVSTHSLVISPEPAHPQ